MATKEDSALGDQKAGEIDTKWKSKRVGGRFEIPWGGFKLPGFKAVMEFMCSKSGSNIPSSDELDRILPVLKPDVEKLRNPPGDEIQATWIGHATVLVQMDGVNILTDPIFSDYCGPVSMPPVPKRYRKVPFTIQELPIDIHAVVISHNHYDHLDVHSVRQLNAKYKQLTWFVPLGLRDWMIHTGCTNVKELDWWQEECLTERPDVKFVFTPAQHWCRRGLADRNKVLWGSWCVVGPTQRFYFAGDTGYCHEGLFSEIGKRYKPFDLAAIPIGACEPREFMKSQHINPEEAFEIHKEIGAKKSVGIHWGTFNLSHEFYMFPKTRILELANASTNTGPFVTVNIGETLTSKLG